MLAATSQPLPDIFLPACVDRIPASLPRSHLSIHFIYYRPGLRTSARVSARPGMYENTCPSTFLSCNPGSQRLKLHSFIFDTTPHLGHAGGPGAGSAWQHHANCRPLWSPSQYRTRQVPLAPLTSRVGSALSCMHLWSWKRDVHSSPSGILKASYPKMR